MQSFVDAKIVDIFFFKNCLV